MSGTDRQIDTKEIVCDNGMPAFMARPAGAGPYPVVILIHERYGLVPHTRDLAKKCASDGFLVVAANYFFKHPDQKALNAGDARYDMTDAESIEDLLAWLSPREAMIVLHDRALLGLLAALPHRPAPAHG